MRKKILYSTLAISSLFSTISLYFSIKHPINFWVENLELWKAITYHVFEFMGSTSDVLHLITGLPSVIFFALLSLSLWVCLYVLFLLIWLILPHRKSIQENNLTL
jgi:hypothetical protein